jgi:predicted dienelactone hydrolase
MRKMRIFLGVVAVLIAGAGAAAYMVTPTVHEGQSGEAPELGRFGTYQIGTIATPFTMKDRSRITGWGALTGKLEATDRTLNVRFWYPSAVKANGEGARYDHIMQLPGKPPFAVSSKGFAIADTAPLKGQKFPLVLMSHGYGGWNTQFSNLAEQIASRGYVVASIDHADMPADGIASFMLSFGNVLVDRTLDQREILAQILDGATKSTAPHLALIDSTNVGLIGYSMGGYGAISTAGGAYGFDKDPMSNIPDSARLRLQQAAKQPVVIKALVAFSPWGGQPESRAWNADSLSHVKVPTLVVVGNQDDVVKFKDGVSWVFNSMTGAERYMLVYREARHNIVGNEFILGPDAPFMAAEFLKEPVWRSERLNAVNQHFVTAFLDLTLKGETAKRAYLDVPTVDSNAGEWPTSFGEQLNGTVAGSKQGKYWRGFQRRWATGLELHHKMAGQ